MEMSYNTEVLATLYGDYSHNKPFYPEIDFSFFGDLNGASLVDFGCGNGSFLKVCLQKGAAYCLGLDLNEAMIKKALEDGENIKNISEGKLKFIVLDCMKPIDQTGQFDFAVSQFVLHHCSDEEKLLNYYKNMLQMLKSNGKALITMSPAVNTREVQEIVGDLSRTVLPLKSDGHGKDPFLVQVPCLYPMEQVKEGKVGPREAAFYFSSYYWSKEKLMKIMEDAGFNNVNLIDPLKVDMEDEWKQRVNEILADGEPYIFIGGEK